MKWTWVSHIPGYCFTYWTNTHTPLLFSLLYIFYLRSAEGKTINFQINFKGFDCLLVQLKHSEYRKSFQETVSIRKTLQVCSWNPVKLNFLPLRAWCAGIQLLSLFSFISCSWSVGNNQIPLISSAQPCKYHNLK